MADSSHYLTYGDLLKRLIQLGDALEGLPVITAEVGAGAAHDGLGVLRVELVDGYPQGRVVRLVVG